MRDPYRFPGDWPRNGESIQTGRETVEISLTGPSGFARGGFTMTIIPLRVGGTDAPVLSKIGPAGRPVTAALDAWVAHLLGRGERDRSVRSYRRKVEECARACGWVTAADVRLGDAEGWLAGKRAGSGGGERWSGTTADHATSILRRFGAWLHREERLESNPLEHLESSGEQGGDGSRALTVEEVRAMIAAARHRAAGDKRQRADAALYFAFLALTGLRDGEAGRCCWRDLDLDGQPPALYTDPAWAKNRRRMRVVLNDEIRGLLLAHRRRTGGAGWLRSTRSASFSPAPWTPQGPAPARFPACSGTPKTWPSENIFAPMSIRKCPWFLDFRASGQRAMKKE